MGGVMSSIVVSGDTSGAITIAAPAVAGTNTITLPAATGTAMVSGNMPAFSAYQSSAQTLASTTWTKLQFQTKEFDTSNAFDNTTNYRFTPQVAGYYQVNGLFNIGSSNTSGAIQLYKNGSTFKNGTSFASAGTVFQSFLVSALVYLNGSTDYIELYGYVINGQILSATSSSTYFQAFLVRAA